MRLGIIGNGTVGHATARAFIEHVEEVRIYDVLPERRTHGLWETLEADLTFICLPTLQKKDSLECDVSALDSLGDEIAHYEGNLVLRSTVPIGTTRQLAKQYSLTNIVHSPEFLTARCAVQDAQMPARNIIGSQDGSELAYVLSGLYQRRFPGIPTYYMSSDESEAVKLIQNSFFAVKVAFFNEARCLTDRLGLGWESIREAILADGRIGSSHTQVPGPDGKFGFGGACLPKDLASFLDCAEKAGLGAHVGIAALHRNQLIDRERKFSHEAVIREALGRDMG